MMLMFHTQDESRRQYQFDMHAGADKPKLQLRDTTPWLKQFSILLQRSFRQELRKKDELWTQYIQIIVMAVLIGTAYLHIGTTQKSIVKRGPAMFFCAVNMGMFASMTTINSFPGERMLTLRERASGTYMASAYFTASKCHCYYYYIDLL
jgi:ATP-binding cassette, subfamily G (WHITE), member 2